jgi:hypothetical protein
VATEHAGAVPPQCPAADVRITHWLRLASTSRPGARPPGAGLPGWPAGGPAGGWPGRGPGPGLTRKAASCSTEAAAAAADSDSDRVG